MNHEVNEIVDCLLKGGIVLIPTDTVYGLAVKPDFEESIGRLYTLKNRPRHLNLPIMVSSVNELECLGIEINNCARRLLESRFVPGALTLALGFKDKPLVPWLKDREEVAIRIPNNQRLLSVLKETGPLLVTSANKHGLPSSKSLQEILGQLNGKPDKMIDGGDLRTVPSTLINCRLNPPVVERFGDIPELELIELLQ